MNHAAPIAKLPSQPRFPHNRVMTAREFAEQICSTLRAAGHQAYLVGGCVRDILLGREPADYDVATDATPDRVEEIFPNSLTVGAQFGVVVVIAESSEENNLQVEVATFRSDVGYSDGRHPDAVAFTTRSKAPRRCRGTLPRLRSTRMASPSTSMALR